MRPTVLGVHMSMAIGYDTAFSATDCIWMKSLILLLPYNIIP